MAISPHTFLAVAGGARAVEAELARWEDTCRAALLEARLDRLQQGRTGPLALLDRRGALTHTPPDLPAVAPHHWAEVLARVQRTGQELEADLPGLIGRNPTWLAGSRCWHWAGRSWRPMSTSC